MAGPRMGLDQKTVVGGTPSPMKDDTSIETPSTPGALRTGVSAAKMFSHRCQRRYKVLREAGPERFGLGLCAVARINLGTGQM